MSKNPDMKARDIDDMDDSQHAEGAAETLDGAGTADPTDVGERIETLEAELYETRERYLRAEAELQNVIKRHSREVSERARYAAEGLGRDLLDIIDDLDRALDHVATIGGDTGGDDLRGVVEGVRLVRGALLAALERHGINRLDAHGQPFDPGEHDAVTMVESAEHGPNTVVAEHRAGYRIHDRLLRPAMVAVSKPPADEPNDK
ncbi:MAG: nucleotide exchange factor GrpE [Myxococcales bacterium]|nr:MAG: nucleotide exchange factor GrpE [Myxococcales bacterium]